MSQVVFLTGATGVVGSGLLPKLLADPSCRVLALVRARDADHLAQRRQALLAFVERHYGSALPEAYAERLMLLAGDTGEAELGLSATDRARVQATATHFVHSAASVRMNLPLEEARRSALYATQAVVALAKASARFTKLDFVSTVGVGGRLPGPLRERWMDQPRDFHNSYEAAKAETEDFLRGEADAGLPLTVHRPSMVVGDAHSGAVIHFQIFYFLCDFLSGRRTFGIYPDLSQGTLDIIPNDYVGAAIAWAMSAPEATGQILHLCSGPRDALSLDELRRRLETLLPRRPWPPHLGLTLSNQRFLALMQLFGLIAGGSTRRAVGTLPVFLDYLSDPQAFGNEASDALLRAQGIERPDPWAVVERCLAFWAAEKGR